MTDTLPTVAEIAKTIDHALLRPDMTLLEVHAGLLLARDYDLYSVCVRPADIELAVSTLAGSDVKVGTVVGFPHGASTTATKVFETSDAATRGAVEIDFVLNIGWLKSNLRSELLTEMQQIKAAADAADIEKVKVIFETFYLSPDEITLAATIAENAGIDFIKTSTGFAGEGATLPNVVLMRGAVTEAVEVKASGGVRDLDTLLAMRAAGVTRFGTSAALTILDDLASRLAGNGASGKQGSGAY